MNKNLCLREEIKANGQTYQLWELDRGFRVKISNGYHAPVGHWFESLTEARHAMHRWAYQPA